MGVSIWQIIILLPVALLPSIIATIKVHPHRHLIILVNILGSIFLGAGWFIALIWCFIVPKHSITKAEEIEKLYELKEKGALTEKEFQHQKEALG